MKVQVEEVKAGDLEPGDLFSTAGRAYWDKRDGWPLGYIGEKVYIRTNVPCPEDQADQKIYKVTVHK